MSRYGTTGTSSPWNEVTDRTYQVEELSVEQVQTKQSIASKVGWGYALGVLGMASLESLYFTFCLSVKLFCGSHSTENGVSKDSPCPSHITPAHQIDQLNFINRSSIPDDFTRTVLGYGVYLMAAGLLMSMGNLLKHKYLESRRASDQNQGLTESSSLLRQHTDKTEILTNLVTAGEMDYTRSNYILGTSLTLGFAVFNALFCFAYLDSADEAKSSLPDYNNGLLKAFNQEAGWISFGLNVSLNQWFAFLVIKMVINKYRETKLMHFRMGGNNKWPWLNTLKSLIKIGALSIPATFPFFALAKDDKSPNRKLPVWLVAASSLPVYGLVLNTEGTMGMLSDISKVWSYVNHFDMNLLRSLDSLKSYGLNKNYGIAHLTGVAGYPLYQMKMLFKELMHLTSINRSQKNRNDVIQSIKIPNLIPATAAITGKNIELPLPTLEKTVKFALRSSPDALLTLDEIKHLKIIAEQAVRDTEVTKQDIWNHGRVKKTLFTPIKFAGPFAGAMVLFAYFNIVKSITAELISCDPNSAVAASLAFALFSPFVNLVLKSTYSGMSETLDATEELAISAYTTISNRFEGVGLNTSTALSLMKCAFTALKVLSFFAAPASAGSAVKILNESYYLHTHESAKTFAIHVAFWGTALFNSTGFANFLSYIENKINDYITLEEAQRDNIRHAHQLFRTIENHPEHEEALSDNPRGHSIV